MTYLAKERDYTDSSIGPEWYIKAPQKAKYLWRST
jgi:hypothetical protein